MVAVFIKVYMIQKNDGSVHDTRIMKLWCAFCFKIITQAIDPKNKNQLDFHLFCTKIDPVFIFCIKIDPIFDTQKLTRFLSFV